MSKQVELSEAKTQFDRLVEEAAGGEEIVIAQNGKPIARLVALAKSAPKEKRRLGVSDHHLIEVVPRETADAEIEMLFEAGKLWPDE